MEISATDVAISTTKRNAEMALSRMFLAVFACRDNAASDETKGIACLRENIIFMNLYDLHVQFKSDSMPKTPRTQR